MALLTRLEGWHRAGPPILVEQQAQTTFPAEGLPPDTQNVVPFPKLARIGSHRIGPPILVTQRHSDIEGSDRFVDTPLTHPLVRFAIGRGRGPIVEIAQAAFQTEAAVVTPDAGALVVTGFAPQVNLSVVPDTATLSATLYAPQANLGVIPGTATLGATLFAPQANLGVIPGLTALTTTLYAPQVGLGVIPSTQALSLTTYAPTITASANAPVLTTGMAPMAAQQPITPPLPWLRDDEDLAGELL